MPTTLLALFIVALLWSGAPSNAPNVQAVIDQAAKLGVVETTMLVITILVLGLITQPLQLALVRFFEGYWGSTGFGYQLSEWGIAAQKNRRQTLVNQTQTSKRADQISDKDLAQMTQSAWQLRQHYPAEDRLLPTSLGNALRASEDLAGNRYGLDAVVVWPRLFPFLSPAIAGLLADSRNQLDLTVRFCASFMLAAVIAVLFLYPHGWWILITVILLVLARLSYRSAIETAVAYGELIQSAFDLHRFDLLSALHLSLPSDREGEINSNQALCDFLRQGVPVNFTYQHPEKKK